MRSRYFPFALLSVACLACSKEPEPLDYGFTYDGKLETRQPITFSGLSSAAQDYRWDFGDGTAPGTGRSPVHTFRKDGTFSVTLTTHTDGRYLTYVQHLDIAQSDTLLPYFAAVVGTYRLTRERSTTYGVTTCDIPVTASRSGDRLILQYAGGSTSNELALAPLTYKPGYYSFRASTSRTSNQADFKIGTDSIFLDSYYSGLTGGTQTWTWGKKC